RRPCEHVSRRFVVGHEDPVSVQRRQPSLEHLAVDEAVVDAHEGDARGRLAQPRLRSDLLTCPTERWPASARSCAIWAIGLPLARSPESLSNMGRLTPVTTSTLRSVRNDTQRLVGEPPSRSVRRSTPSP